MTCIREEEEEDCVFSHFGGDTLGVSNSGAEKGACMDNFWSIRQPFYALGCHYLENSSL